MFVGLLLGVVLGVAATVTVVRLRQRSPRSGPSFHEVLDMELERARRYERPMSVIRVRHATPEVGTDPTWTGLVRRTDHVFTAPGVVEVIAPETDRSAAEVLAANVSLRVRENGEAVAAIATFPTDALTAHGVLASLDAQPDPAPARLPMPRPQQDRQTA